MKRVLVIMVIILSLILTSFPTTQEGDGAQNGVLPLLNDPVQPPDGGTVYFQGAWNITDLREYKNCTIIADGNITIKSGGNLVLRNVTLIMNNSNDKQWKIDVWAGGEMHIFDWDNNPATNQDRSNITVNDTAYTFLFLVRDGATFELRNSEIHHCGYGLWVIEPSAPSPAYDGLFINTDNAVIDHNNFSYNYDGLVLYNSDAVVSNNTFYWNKVGVRATTYSDALIENNWFGWNSEYGLEIDGWDNTNGPWPSNPTVINNTIIKTGRDKNTAVAVQIMFSCKPLIENLQLIDWTEDGIYIGYNSQPVINNVYMEPDGGNYGIVSASTRTTGISNTTIVGNTGYYHLEIAEGALQLTNSTFNRASVEIDSGSNLTVNWFLHTHVNDSAGKPIPNANVHITDNANGTYDRNFTTDENGWVKWIVLRDYWQNSTTTIDYNDYTVSVSYPGVSFINNNRSVKMNISRTEYFTATTEADTDPPIISNIIPADGDIVPTGDKINVSADVEDYNKTSDIGNVTLHWSSDSWFTDNTVPMWLDNSSAYSEKTGEELRYVGGRWYADIPPQAEGTQVQFYITASDVIGNSANSASETITAAAPASTDPFVVYGYVYLYNGSGTTYNPLLCDGTEYNNADVVVSWINSTDGSVNTASTATDSLGRYQADLYNYSDGGTVWVNASDSTNGARYEVNSTAINAADGGAMVNVTFGVPYRLNITNPTNGSTVIRGNAFNVVYTVYDSHGVISPGYYGAVNLTSNDTLANLPPDYTFAGVTDGGTATVSCILNTGGIFYINATDTLNDMSRPSLYPETGQWWDQILLNVTTGGFTWDLSVRGWHIVSVPQIPIATNDTASEIVSLIHYTAQRDGIILSDITIANRTGANPSTYDSYIYGSGGVDFPITIGMAYWVYVDTGFPSSVFIQATNYTAGTFSRTVFDGWNMIGLAHNDSVGVLANGGLVQFADSDGAGPNIGIGPADGYISYTGTPWYISYWDVGTQKYRTYIYKFDFNNFNDAQNAAVNIYAGAEGFWIYVNGGGSMSYSVEA